MTTRELQRIMPTTYFLIFLLLTIGSHFLFPIKRLIYPPYTFIGVIFLILGIIINLWTDQMFKRSSTTVKPHLMPIVLETSGPFRISRHPMYLGMAIALLGVAIIQGSLVGFFFSVFFVIAMEIIFIPMEEENLIRAFGQRYLDYKKKVRRWI